MDSVFPEVREVLKALNKKLRQASDVQFTAQGIGNAISGLQTMTNTDGPEITEALALLTQKLESCPHEMEPLDLSNALFGE
jgi:Ran GTPase-activating protein (RanGAP) involved in mRNA processing and transport